MKIIIVGCGKVGVSLAERLSAEGHDLVMVDMNPQKVEHLSNQFDAWESLETAPASISSRKPEWKMRTSLSLSPARTN